MRCGLMLGVFCFWVCLWGGVVFASDEDLSSTEVIAMAGLNGHGRETQEAVYLRQSGAWLIPEDDDLAVSAWEARVKREAGEVMGLLDMYKPSLIEQKAGALRILIIEVGDGGKKSEIDALSFAPSLAPILKPAPAERLEQIAPEAQMAQPPYYVVIERLEADSLLLETPQGKMRVSRDFLPAEMIQEGCVFEILEAKGERRRRLSEGSERIERMQRGSHALVKEGSDRGPRLASVPKTAGPKS